MAVKKKDEPKELTISISGTEYPFPAFDTLTFKEARLIKSQTGLVMGQFFNALEQGDPDALMAIALIALQRDAKPYEMDDLDRLTLTKIFLVGGDQEEDGEDVDPASPLDGSAPPADDANSEKRSSSEDGSSVS